MEMTTLPSRWCGQAGNGLRRAVPGRCDHDEVGLAGDLVRGAVQVEDARPPLLTKLGRDLLSALGRARADRHRHADRRQPGGKSLARRAGPSENSYVHGP